MKRIVLIAALLLVSCGSKDDGGASAAAGQYAQLVEEESDLPECGDDSEGMLVYVKAAASFSACSAGAWSAIDIKGKDGKDGIAPAEQYTCGTSRDLDATANNTLKGVFANVTKFTDGSVFLSCMGMLNNDSQNFLDTVSDSIFFAADGDAVKSGKVTCEATYVVGTYDIDANKITYADSSDTTEKDVVECDKL
jgi:major membrane immunogen (membrane-anchored lipoprotein)